MFEVKLLLNLARLSISRQEYNNYNVVTYTGALNSARDKCILFKHGILQIFLLLIKFDIRGRHL